MNDPPRTLADLLRVIYEYYLRALLDDDIARKWAGDELINCLGAAPTFRRIGGPVWWLDREPSGPADNTPFVIASFDPKTDRIRFDIATLNEVQALAHAEDFMPDGMAMSGKPESLFLSPPIPVRKGKRETRP